MLSLGAIKSEAATIRSELHKRRMHHADKLTDLDLHKLYTKLSALPVDERVGLAADALVQWPRPDWLTDLIGPYPLELELLNPADVASVEEWGSCG